MIPPRLAAFASRVGLTGLVIAVLCALLAVQTIRLEGFRCRALIRQPTM